jgi:hypothetical protein
MRWKFLPIGHVVEPAGLFTATITLTLLAFSSAQISLLALDFSLHSFISFVASGILWTDSPILVLAMNIHIIHFDHFISFSSLVFLLRL